MKIGLGLPANIPGVTGEQVLAWARKADAGPFSSLALIDRLVYSNYDVLISLAAAAGATERIRLMSSVLLAPLRNPAILAKQGASLDALSGGRLTLGMSVGAREDDYLAAGVPFHSRGKIFDEQLATMHQIWSGQPLSENVSAIGPAPVQPGGPEILLGGYTEAALKRLRRWGNGYIAGGGGPQRADQFFRMAEETWKDAGRPGRPRLVGAAYVALGQDGLERGGAYIRDYYRMIGPMVERMAAALPTTSEAIKGMIGAFADIGADELILWPTTTDPVQIDQLADLVG
ncbi:MAG TPA: LLM class flavin-dependent oxidoreductase [Ktedonobacteraceae bacterium]|nr:LLM class flavin-dependent oxidoreductase [Ktedonobacteraceae bacterium]